MAGEMADMALSEWIQQLQQLDEMKKHGYYKKN